MKASFYKDKKKQWRWRLVSRNGRVLADSGEGYRRAVDAWRGLRRILNTNKLDVTGYEGASRYENYSPGV